MKIIKSYKIHTLIKKINEALDPELEKRLRMDLKAYCEDKGKDYGAICKLAGLDTKGFSSLSSDTVKLIEEMIRNGAEWSYDDKTGLVNVNGDLLYSISRYSSSSTFNDYSEVKKILRNIKFGKVEGDFRISRTEIDDETWESICPEYVSGFLDLSYNELTKVKLPPYIGGSINISYNNIDSLKDCPENVNGYFDCSDNRLLDLEGGPRTVDGNYECSNQKISYPDHFKLTGCAEKIGKSLEAKNNRMVTMEGGPIEIGAGMNVSDNELETLKGNLRKISHDQEGARIDVSNNRLSSLEGLPLDIKRVGSSYGPIECAKNVMQPKVMKETYLDAAEMKSWIAAYLKLAATQKFKKMGKAQRDPIVSKITPELIAKNPAALAPIWRDEELLNDPVIKRRIKQSGITKDEAFKKDVDMLADLNDLGF